jgi:hypothetical protein
MSFARSRFVDFAPSDAGLSLTQGDVKLLSLLQEYPYLPLPYIGELLGASRKVYAESGKEIVRYPSLRARVGRLRKDGGYLRCPPQSWQAANSRYRPAVYALTPKAKALLQSHETGLSSIRLGNDFAHDLGCCLVAASFKLAVQHDERLRFIPFREILDHPACPETTRDAQDPLSIPVSYIHGSEHVTAAKAHDWAPWGIGLRLENGRERRIFFPGHEFDRSSEPLETADPRRSSIIRHLLGILALLEGGYRKHFGLPAVFVPFVTIGEGRMRSIMRLLLKLTGGVGSKYILFKYVDDFASYSAFPPATGHMLTEPWERAGFGQYSILSEMLAPPQS